MLAECGIYNDVTARDRAIRERETGTVELAIDCVTPDGSNITAFMYLILKDGSLATRTIDRLKEAVGWDGADFEYLVNGEWPAFQIDVQDEVYNGETKRKVKWLNPNESTGGGGVGSSDDIGMLKSKYSSKFRAYSGGKTIPPPKKEPVNKPPEKKSVPDRVSTQEAVWEILCKLHSKEPEQEVRQEWFKLIEKSGKQQHELTPEEWGTIAYQLDNLPF